MTFRLGLTGSIGMGKSTTARMFAELGCDLWDADAAVHRLYKKNGLAVAGIKAIWPQAIVDGQVSREVLKTIIQSRPDALKEIEAIVHPLVAQDRENFISQSTADILVFDIPLLFETGTDSQMDAVVCVTVTPELQKKRVLERGNMTLRQFEQIRSKQMPNDEKCARSDYVIVTDTLDHAQRQVQSVIQDVRRRMADA